MTETERLNNGLLEVLLIRLPEEKAEHQGIIINLLIERSDFEKRLDEIKTGISLRVSADKAITNELSRKSAIMYALSQNPEYLKIEEQLKRLNLCLDLKRIEYQKAHDLLQSYIAIATMRSNSAVF